MAGEWTLIGTTTLGSAGDTISVSGLDARNFLYIEIQLIEDGNLDSYITFNSDTSGGNYSLRYSADGGSEGTLTSQNNLALGGDPNNSYTVVYISNPDNTEKVALISKCDGDSSAGNAPERTQRIGKWASNSQITSIDVTNTGAGNYDTGSTVNVWASSD